MSRRAAQINPTHGSLRITSSARRDDFLAEYIASTRSTNAATLLTL